MTKLGKNQREVLRALVVHRTWPGGWVWENTSSTTRLLDSLVKRGLVKRTDDERGRLVSYTPTEDGILEAKGRLDWREREYAARQASAKARDAERERNALLAQVDKNVVVLTDAELYALNMAVIYIADGEDNEAVLRADLGFANSKLMEADEKMQERQHALATS